MLHLTDLTSVRLFWLTMSSSESGSDWEGEEVEVQCVCLFCSREFEHGAKAVLVHCTEEHKFDLMGLVADKGSVWDI